MNIRTKSKVVFVAERFCSVRNPLSELTRIERNLESKAIYSFVNFAISTCFYKSACLPLHGANDRQNFRLLLSTIFDMGLKDASNVWGKGKCGEQWEDPGYPSICIISRWVFITFLPRTSSPRFTRTFSNFFEETAFMLFFTLFSSSGTE